MRPPRGKRSEFRRCARIGALIRPHVGRPSSVAGRRRWPSSFASPARNAALLNDFARSGRSAATASLSKDGCGSGASEHPSSGLVSSATMECGDLKRVAT
jgi:hypothetical protein